MAPAQVRLLGHGQDFEDRPRAVLRESGRSAVQEQPGGARRRSWLRGNPRWRTRNRRSGSASEQARLEEVYTGGGHIGVVQLRMIRDLGNGCIETRCGAVGTV